MKRQTGIALAAAVLIGSSAGAIVALNDASLPAGGSNASPPKTSQSTPSTNPAAGGSSAPTSAEETGGDGEVVIELTDLGDAAVVSVDRLDDGYLVGTTGNGNQESYDLQIVDLDGNIEYLSKTTATSTSPKTASVSVDSTTNRAVVWSSEGKVIGRTVEPDGNMELAEVGFVKDQAAIVSTNVEGPSLAIRWDPETYEIKRSRIPTRSMPGSVQVVATIPPRSDRR